MDISCASWREKSAPGIFPRPSDREYPSVVGSICPKCTAIHPLSKWKEHWNVCPQCGYHKSITRSQRIALLLDEIYHEIGDNYLSKDYLNFTDTQSYAQRLIYAEKKTKYTEALSVHSGRLDTHRIVLATFDFDFIGGSMSTAVGKRFVEGVQYCMEHRFPLVCQALSGGARMQEGAHSLIQMMRTSAALARLSSQKIPYIVTLVSPCMGGVSASLASLGDITLAEPNALIGFTGPRVIAQTVGESLPAGFQTSTFVQRCGQIDQIVSRKDLRATISRWLCRFRFGQPL